ncbi:MAG TPA: ergothioneine biosynthesis protein EgtB [Candidatus Dormibacteraeota bacterium]|jgi:iron(II)-dependent oxidoreductase|nr:ergothioneine biosynthesis protein EgtB [Candidatus Dormibacteraeota bacterium]
MTLVGDARKLRIAAALEDARSRTIALLAEVSDELLEAQPDPILSPLIWDYGHIGVYEQLWLVDALSGQRPADERGLDVYDAFRNPRRTRSALPLMDRAEVDRFRDGVRERVLVLLAEADLDGGDALLRDGYVYDLVVQHEHQHGETMLQSLQILPGGYRPALPALPSPVALRRRDPVAVPAGRYPVGSASQGPYDNERPQHAVDLGAFRIDRFPVTCGDFARFVDDGGYQRPSLWGDEGWRWVTETGVRAPKHWDRDGGQGVEWTVERFGHVLPLRADLPVMHVCFHEAQAYARWAGGRLPTEFEWEVAATWDPAAGRARRYPWGDEPPTASHANLDQRSFGPAPIGAYPAGASALGCEQMIGDVWEWTSSHFQAYPGFAAFPYREYSEVFFGSEYRVLRGASWAARAGVARPAFRNWDYPIRRQVFAGLRCAYD